MSTQTVQDGSLKGIAADVDPVIARALVARGRARAATAEQIL
jgi:hypothetical protein